MLEEDGKNKIRNNDELALREQSLAVTQNSKHLHSYVVLQPADGKQTSHSQKED